MPHSRSVLMGPERAQGENAVRKISIFIDRSLARHMEPETPPAEYSMVMKGLDTCQQIIRFAMGRSPDSGQFYCNERDHNKALCPYHSEGKELRGVTTYWARRIEVRLSKSDANDSLAISLKAFGPQRPGKPEPSLEARFVLYRSGKCSLQRMTFPANK